MFPGDMGVARAGVAHASPFRACTLVGVESHGSHSAGIWERKPGWAHPIGFSGGQTSYPDGHSVSPPLEKKLVSLSRLMRWWLTQGGGVVVEWVTALVAAVAGIVSVLKQDMGTPVEFS